MAIAIVVLCSLLACAAILWVTLYNKVVKKDILCQDSWEHAMVEIEGEAAVAREVKDALRDHDETQREFVELTAAIDALEDASDTPHTLAASDSLSTTLTSMLATLSQTMGLTELATKVSAAFERSTAAKDHYRSTVSDFNRSIEEFPTRVVAEPRFRKRDLAVAEA